MTDQPIAVRIIQDSESGGAIHVSIYAPRIHNESGDWACRVVMKHEVSNHSKQSECYGIDGIQALQQTFAYIRRQLLDGQTWLSEPAVLGFPASLPNVFGLEFYREMEKLVLQKETEYVQTHRRKRD